MNLETLASVGEFVGGLGVLLTLLYLARETRLNTKAVKASSFHAANASLAELNLRIAENPELGSLVARSLDTKNDKSSFSDEEWARFQNFGRSMFNSFEAIHIQYRQGLLDQDLWEKRMGTCKWFTTMLPVWSAWWSEEKTLGIQLESFVDAVDNATPMSGAAKYVATVDRS